MQIEKKLVWLKASLKTMEYRIKKESFSKELDINNVQGTALCFSNKQEAKSA